jgi:2,3-bisphosphoglycerate-dependent phosphoglycerate mutase
MTKKMLFLCLLFMPFLAFNQIVTPYNTNLKMSKKGKIGKVQIEGFNDPNTTIFFIVRHAEKDTAGGSNADLNAIGRGRAQAEVEMFKKVRIDGIFSTDRPRTRNTAAPIAASKKLMVEIYDAKKQKELLEKLAVQAGKHFFIVGHSNTVHQMVNILRGSDEEKEFSESDYSRLYIVSVKKMGDTKMQLIRF